MKVAYSGAGVFSITPTHRDAATSQIKLSGGPLAEVADGYPIVVGQFLQMLSVLLTYQEKVVLGMHVRLHRLRDKPTALLPQNWIWMPVEVLGTKWADPMIENFLQDLGIMLSFSIS